MIIICFSCSNICSTRISIDINLFLIICLVKMSQFNFNITERARGDFTTRPSTQMNRSMISSGNTMNGGNYTARTPRLSELLPEDRVKCEEMMFEGKGGVNSSMILTSRRNRKNSEISFNQQLLQNANRSKLVDSRIMEPLKFGDKVSKTPKHEEEISKNMSGMFGTPNQSPQSEHIPSNHQHLSFNSSRIMGNQMAASGLKFKDSPKVDQPDKHRKSVMDYINVHTEEVLKEGENQGHNNLMKYKTSMLRPAKDSMMFKGKQSYIGNQEPTTPNTSSPSELTTKKVEIAFGSEHMKNFLKKHSVEQAGENDHTFKKSKQVESKDCNFSDFTASESLRSSINKLNREDFYFGKRLGKGKFGQVFLVKHKEIGFLCAMKIISKKVILHQKIQNQLCAEIKIQQYLSHPNIAALYGVFSDQQNIYLLLEPCLEGQLYQKMKKSKRMPQKETSALVKQICVATDYLHSEKIIHRDLKPQNILLSEGVIKICDFGWAAFHNDQFRDTFCGTPLYLSPELLNQDAYDDKVDNWAIGILTYEMLIGRIPFKITTKEELEKILFQEIVFPEHVEISDVAKNFILLMLERDPTKRAELESVLIHPFLTVE